ncbi:uncharacterized protein ACJ7VT_006096 [Polymixia lowei]
MSWAEEDWTVGLSGRVLQKVKELQVQQERLSREGKQRQLQLDNTQAALHKQTVKYEEVRRELQAVQRELQGVCEEAQVGVCTSQRLTQELQSKQAQVCSLEGQLDAAHTLTHTLTQEVKRLEAELEKLQNSSRPGDTSLFSTPCWNMTSPWEHSGGRKEEKPGHKGEGESRGLHVRQQLQFSDTPTASLPRQQNKNTPLRHPSNQSDTFSAPSAAFPWERDDSRAPAARGCRPPSPQTPSVHDVNRGQREQGDCGKAEVLRRETDESVSELQSRVCALEEELRAEAQRLKASQEQLGESRRELATREQNDQKTRNQLSLAQTRITQESDRASGAEQRLKQLQEELKCQRQNADSSRLQHQQRIKDLEKLHQRDLSELQKERQSLEKQHQQEVNKLNQELQQARTLHNALQAQAEKVSLQKQALESEVQALKEKLKWTEGQLQESQRKDAQTQAKLTEALREAEGVAVSLQQSKRREKALEEEGRRLAEERADSLRLLKELQDQKAAPAPPVPPVQFCPAGQSFSPQPYSSHHPRPSAQTKRPAAASSARAEPGREEERGREVTPKYPVDREPGEGIDSEHIAAADPPDCEHSRSGGERRKAEEEEGKSGNEADDDAMRCDSPGTDCTAPAPLDRGPEPKREAPPAAPEDLRRENAALRSDLRDVREELQKRLEDLEVQRRAEAEARSRLKQLSRKHTSQAADREEKERERRTELERERAEAERLRKALAALEAVVKREREERGRRETEEEEEEGHKALEDRESELMELNIQLKKQLAEVKAQLALEREEREEEERRRLTNTGGEGKRDMSLKLAELQAELEELKNRGKKEPLEENKEANSPLAYLTLHDDELNSNIIGLDNKPLPPPDQHRLLCQSTNQRNAAVSQATADLIQEERTGKGPECSPLSNEEQTTPQGQTGGLASDLEGTTLENHLGVSCLSDQGESPLDPQRGVSAPCDLTREMERLREENAKEVGRANQCQAKLEALQTQVTRQTQQLTSAFERQSQHITDLLAELQEKESALLSQGGELQRCRQELAALRAEKEEEDKKRREEGEKITAEEEGEERQGEKTEEESSEVPPDRSQELANVSLSAGSLTEAASVVPSDIITEGQQSTQQGGEKSEDEDEGGDGEREEKERSVEEESGKVPQLQISLLEQQVVALQAALLSQEEELAALRAPKEEEEDEEKKRREEGERMTAEEVADEEEGEEKQERKQEKPKDETAELQPHRSQEFTDASVTTITLTEAASAAPGDSGEPKTGPRAEKEHKEKKRGEEGGRMTMVEEEEEERQEEKMMEERSELPPNRPHEFANVSLGAGSLTEAGPATLRDSGDPETVASDAERPAARSSSQHASGDQKPDREAQQSVPPARGSAGSDRTENDQHSVCMKETSHPTTPYRDSREDGQDGGAADLVAELLSLRQENLQLKQRVEALTVSDTAGSASDQILHNAGEDHAASVEQSTNPGTNEATSWSEEQRARSLGAPSDIITEGQQSTWQDGEKSEDEDEGGDGEGEREEKERSVEEESGKVPQPQISLLEQQVVALQAELQAVSEENQRQAEELAIWRLASQPAPTVDQDLIQTCDQSEIQDQTSVLFQTPNQSSQQQTHNVSHDLSETQASTPTAQARAPTPGPEEPAALGVSELQHCVSTVTVIREDELLLSCSSNKLHGRMLASRLQHNNLLEPKSLPPAPKTSAPQDYIEDPAIVDEESEKENMDSNTSKRSKTKPTQHREWRQTDAILRASDEGVQQHATKDPRTISGPQTKATERRKEEPEAKPNAPRATDKVITTTGDPLERRGCWGQSRSAGTQTEGSPQPAGVSTASEHRHACTQTEGEEGGGFAPVSPAASSEAGFGDRMLLSGSFPIPADPARLAERIRRNRSQLSAAYDDTEYEPYGLPEVVMKGFADIPSGPACPYIVRRGLLGTPAVPLPQREPVLREETD